MAGACVKSCDPTAEDHGCDEGYDCLDMPPLPGAESVGGICYNACETAADCQWASACVAGKCKVGVHRIDAEEPVVVPADGYLVLSLKCDPALNGGLEGAYCYETTLGPMNPGFSLNNEGDDLTVRWHLTTIDHVSWTADDVTEGASWSLSDQAMDDVSNDDGTNWCDANGEYFSDATTSLLGTPGTANGTCP